jgi:hypothetical protein
MIAFEAVLLPDNSVQILKPLLAFSRPCRVIITVLDEEINALNNESSHQLSQFEQYHHAEDDKWSPFSTRIPNLHAGLIQIADDFDEPLPDSFWLGEDESTEDGVAIS